MQLQRVQVFLESLPLKQQKKKATQHEKTM